MATCPTCGGAGLCRPGSCPGQLAPNPRALATRRMPAAAAKAPRVLPQASARKAAPRPAPKKAQVFSKAEALARWEKLPKNRTISPKPVPYSHRGSSISKDTIRVSGRKAFIDDILSNLHGLRRFEAGKTRLDISYGQLTEKGSDVPVPGSYRLYIKVCQRG